MMVEVQTLRHELVQAVLAGLKYFALFSYPLTAEEVHSNIGSRCSRQELSQLLNHLVGSGTVYFFEGFYSSEDKIQFLVERRLQANALAQKKIPQAFRIGRLISRFPYVRFVGISGSLSKGYADSNSDFDFFIITRKERLWICRTVLHVFKKLTFLFMQEQKFCMNYFLDESKLQLDEQNIYTAIELSTLIPISGGATFRALQQTNSSWIGRLLPNPYCAFCTTPEVADVEPPLKRILEKTLDIGGHRFNAFLMKITDKRWRRKWKRRNYPDSDYDMAFKTTLYHSKNHPANYQKKILAQLDS